MSAPKKPRPEQLQFPKLPPDINGRTSSIFWLCAWMQHTAVAEALDLHMQQLWGKRAASRVLMHGLSGACLDAISKAESAFQRLIEEGSLLYAFNGTTKTKALDMKGGAAC